MMENTDRPIRLLLFGNENCGLIHSLAKGFKQFGGFKVTTVVCQPDPFSPQNKFDFNLQRPQFEGGNFFTKKIPYYWQMVKWTLSHHLIDKYLYYNYDLYIFSWRTLKENFSDLQELRARGKKIIFLFIGSDVRWIDAFRQEFPGNPYPGSFEEDWKRKFRLLRMGELYSSSVFSVPDQSSLFIRGYYYMFMPVQIENIRNVQPGRTRPRVIHAPSKRDIKGTALILEAVETLKAEGVEFDFEVLEGVSNKTVLSKLEDADILVDQLYLNGPATVATEAMAAGCAVATKYIRDLDITKDAPICYVDYTNILPNLRKLILNLEYRKSLAARGREFVAKNNSVMSIVEKMVDSLNRDERQDFDCYPSFFKKQFELPKNYSYTAELDELNKTVLEKYNGRPVPEKLAAPAATSEQVRLSIS